MLSIFDFIFRSGSFKPGFTQSPSPVDGATSTQEAHPLLRPGDHKQCQYHLWCGGFSAQGLAAQRVVWATDLRFLGGSCHCGCVRLLFSYLPLNQSCLICLLFAFCSELRIEDYHFQKVEIRTDQLEKRSWSQQENSGCSTNLHCEQKLRTDNSCILDLYLT